MDSTTNLCKTANGDAAAFERLVTAHQARVFGFLGRMGLDAATTEDIAQETFLRVWRSAKSYDPRRGAASTWILTIARNLALTHLSRAARIREVANDEAAARAPCDAALADEALEQKEQRGRFDAALARLAPAERSILAASYVGGLDLASIARIEDCSKGAAKVRLFRAREKLKRLLEQDDG